MKRIVEMPEVSSCDVADCAYNLNTMCHARGITVGGPNDHLCDTTCTFRSHTHASELAGVGACKATGCMHNQDLECQADSIQVGLDGRQALCRTFDKR